MTYCTLYKMILKLKEATEQYSRYLLCTCSKKQPNSSSSSSLLLSCSCHRNHYHPFTHPHLILSYALVVTQECNFFFVMYELNLKQIVSTMQSTTVKWLVSYILWLNSSNSLHSSHQLLNVCILGYFHTNLWSSYGENFTFKFLHVCTFNIHARLIIMGS